MPKNGRGLKAKGDKYERELAAHMGSRLEIDIRRTPLSGGGVIHGLSGGADLSGTPELHVEAKRVERLNFMDAMRQAEASVTASQTQDVPIVVNRRNNMTTGESLCVLRLDAFLDMYDAWLKAGRPRAQPEQ